METHDPAEIARAIETLERRWSTAGPHNLPYRILLLAKLIDRITTPHVRRTAGLSLAEWRAMAQIFELQPCSAAEIASRALIDRAEVSRAAASLERRGLLERRENAKDRRSPLLYCTARGTELFKRVAPSRQQFHKSLTDLLTPAQITELEAAMVVLARHCVDELEGAPSEPSSARRLARPGVKSGRDRTSA